MKKKDYTVTDKRNQLEPENNDPMPAQKKDYTLICGLSIIFAAFVAFLIGIIYVASNGKLTNQPTPPTTEELSHYSIYFDGDEWWFKHQTGMMFENVIGYRNDGSMEITKSPEIVKSGISYTSSNAAYAGVLSDIEAHHKTALEEEKQRKKQMAGENVPSLTDLQPVTKFEMDTNLLFLSNRLDELGRNMSNLVADLQKQLNAVTNVLQSEIDGKQDKPITNTLVVTNLYGTNFCIPTNWTWALTGITNSISVNSNCWISTNSIYSTIPKTTNVYHRYWRY